MPPSTQKQVVCGLVQKLDKYNMWNNMQIRDVPVMCLTRPLHSQEEQIWAKDLLSGIFRMCLKADDALRKTKIGVSDKWAAQVMAPGQSQSPPARQPRPDAQEVDVAWLQHWPEHQLDSCQTKQNLKGSHH